MKETKTGGCDTVRQRAGPEGSMPTEEKAPRQRHSLGGRHRGGIHYGIREKLA